jgi:hypothetical protein
VTVPLTVVAVLFTIEPFAGDVMLTDSAGCGLTV